MFKSKKSQPDIHPGFQELTFYRFNAEEVSVDHVELVVPATNAMRDLAKVSIEKTDDAIGLARAEKAERERAARETEAKEASDDDDENASGGLLMNSNSISAAIKKKASTSTVLETDEERAKLKAVYDAGAHEDDACQGDRPKTVEAYAWAEPLKLINSTRTFDRELHTRNQRIYEMLRAKGNRRAIAQPNGDSIDGLMDKLRCQHPHFGEVIDFVSKYMLMSARTDKPLSVPPILLLGPPGVGKTHFCSTLAECIGSVVHRISFDAAVTSSSLLGSDRNWGNTSTGSLFEAVCNGDFANPVFLLDEIDKPRSGGHYQSPLASLHSVLEPVSNKMLTDISLGFQFSVQHVIFVAAGNNPLAVSSTIRSRFTEFRIEAPSGQDALTMAEVMLRSSHTSLNKTDFSMPGRDIARLIAHLTPREQRQTIETAFASAIANGRDRLIRDDLPADVLLDDESVKRMKSGQWIH